MNEFDIFSLEQYTFFSAGDGGGADQFTNHTFDHLFEGLAKDSKRPKDFHPGWWAVMKKFSGPMMAELPFRFEKDLEPEKYVRLIVMANPDLKKIRVFSAEFTIVMTGKLRRMSDSDAQHELINRVFDFYYGVRDSLVL